MLPSTPGLGNSPPAQSPQSPAIAAGSAPKTVIEIAISAQVGSARRMLNLLPNGVGAGRGVDSGESTAGQWRVQPESSSELLVTAISTFLSDIRHPAKTSTSRVSPFVHFLRPSSSGSIHA